MSHWKVIVPSLVIVAGLVVGVMVGTAAAEAKTKALTIKEVMGKFHKGKPPVCEKAAKGQASADELKALLAAYEGMAAQTPKKGDADAWKTKCKALIEATQGLIDMKDGAGEAYQKAVNCKACHSEFK